MFCRYIYRSEIDEVYRSRYHCGVRFRYTYMLYEKRIEKGKVS